MNKYEIFSICFAALAFIISLATLYRQRKRLTIIWDDNLEILDPKEQIRVLGEPYPVKSKVAFFTYVQIVNPSMVNMAYFDLQAINPKTGESHYIATQRTLYPRARDQIFHLNCPSGLEYFFKLPERKFGNLLYGSYNSLDILIFAKPNVSLEDGILILFKVTDTSFLQRSPYSGTNKKIYKTYSKFYPIVDYKKNS